MNKKVIIIKSEKDAYALLKKRLKDDTYLENASITFDGWPKLKIHLIGDKYDQTITPTIMRGFIDLQQEIYRSYVLAKYNSPNIRLLTKDERKDLEIEVKVSEGSSDYEVDLQSLLLTLIEKVSDKMDSVHVATSVISIAVLFFGSSSFRTYLNNRKEIREKELKSDEQIAQIESLKFVSEQETKRSKIMAKIIKKDPSIANIEKTAHDAQTSIIKGIAAADEGEVQGISIDSETAQVLTSNARRKSEDIRLDGEFIILRVDSSDPDEFKVRIKNTTSKEIIDASVQDSSLNQSNKPILQEAEWSRTPVLLTINAKSLKGAIRNATVINVKKA